LLIDPELFSARLIRRYKRFLADVELADGTVTTVHCPNTGSMLGLDSPGIPVWLRWVEGKTRKYPLSWELAEPEPGILVGINTGRSNALVHEAIVAGRIPELTGFADIRREVRVGNSRLDFLLAGGQFGPDCYLEVKNVTAAVHNRLALFPDAVSERASRHVRELMALRETGVRCALVYCVQRGDVDRVEAATEIDPVYARTLCQARESGLEIYALGASVSPGEIVLDRRVGVPANPRPVAGAPQPV
jgi:sugar fermentation stimulation protein A